MSAYNARAVEIYFFIHLHPSLRRNVHVTLLKRKQGFRNAFGKCIK